VYKRQLLERLEFPPEEPLVITPFRVQDRAAFRDLNLEWLRAFFTVEPRDLEILDHPESILDHGGEIYFVRRGTEVIGTGALVRQGSREFELAKMAVSEDARGHGAGRLLCTKLITRFHERGGTRLTLQSNSSLVAAISLYRSLGFVDYEPAEPPDYERTDTHMVLA